MSRKTLKKIVSFKPRKQIACFAISKSYLVFGSVKGSLYVHARETLGQIFMIPSVDLNKKKTGKPPAINKIYLHREEREMVVINSNNEIILVRLKRGSSLSTTTSKIQYRWRNEIKSNISCCCFSQVKLPKVVLFVGYENGALCEVDFSRNALVKGGTKRLLEKGDSKIIQMICQGDKLLFSNLNWTYMVFFSKKVIKKIGKNPREGVFGGCFSGKSYSKDEKPVLYCSRPNGRIWKVDENTGNVLFTYKFRPIRNRRLNFNLMFSYIDDMIITHDETYFMILDIKDVNYVMVRNDFAPILEIKVYRNECHVLHNSKKEDEVLTSLSIVRFEEKNLALPPRRISITQRTPSPERSPSPFVKPILPPELQNNSHPYRVGGQRFLPVPKNPVVSTTPKISLPSDHGGSHPYPDDALSVTSSASSAGSTRKKGPRKQKAVIFDAGPPIVDPGLLSSQPRESHEEDILSLLLTPTTGSSNEKKVNQDFEIKIPPLEKKKIESDLVSQDLINKVLDDEEEGDESSNVNPEQTEMSEVVKEAENVDEKGGQGDERKKSSKGVEEDLAPVKKSEADEDTKEETDISDKLPTTDDQKEGEEEEEKRKLLEVDGKNKEVPSAVSETKIKKEVGEVEKEEEEEKIDLGQKKDGLPVIKEENIVDSETQIDEVPNAVVVEESEQDVPSQQQDTLVEEKKGEEEKVSEKIGEEVTEETKEDQQEEDDERKDDVLLTPEQIRKDNDELKKANEELERISEQILSGGVGKKEKGGEEEEIGNGKKMKHDLKVGKAEGDGEKNRGGEQKVGKPREDASQPEQPQEKEGLPPKKEIVNEAVTPQRTGAQQPKRMKEKTDKTETRANTVHPMNNNNINNRNIKKKREEGEEVMDRNSSIGKTLSSVQNRLRNISTPTVTKKNSAVLTGRWDTPIKSSASPPPPQYHQQQQVEQQQQQQQQQESSTSQPQHDPKTALSQQQVVNIQTSGNQTPSGVVVGGSGGVNPTPGTKKLKKKKRKKIRRRTAQIEEIVGPSSSAHQNILKNFTTAPTTTATKVKNAAHPYHKTSSLPKQPDRDISSRHRATKSASLAPGGKRKGMTPASSSGSGGGTTGTNQSSKMMKKKASGSSTSSTHSGHSGKYSYGRRVNLQQQQQQHEQQHKKKEMYEHYHLAVRKMKNPFKKLFDQIDGIYKFITYSYHHDISSKEKQKKEKEEEEGEHEKKKSGDEVYIMVHNFTIHFLDQIQKTESSKNPAASSNTTTTTKPGQPQPLQILNYQYSVLSAHTKKKLSSIIIFWYLYNYRPSDEQRREKEQMIKNKNLGILLSLMYPSHQEFFLYCNILKKEEYLRRILQYEEANDVYLSQRMKIKELISCGAWVSSIEQLNGILHKFELIKEKRLNFYRKEQQHQKKNKRGGINTPATTPNNSVSPLAAFDTVPKRRIRKRLSYHQKIRSISRSDLFIFDDILGEEAKKMDDDNGGTTTQISSGRRQVVEEQVNSGSLHPYQVKQQQQRKMKKKKKKKKSVGGVEGEFLEDHLPPLSLLHRFLPYYLSMLSDGRKRRKDEELVKSDDDNNKSTSSTSLTNDKKKEVLKIFENVVNLCLHHYPKYYIRPWMLEKYLVSYYEFFSVTTTTRSRSRIISIRNEKEEIYFSVFLNYLIKIYQTNHQIVSRDFSFMKIFLNCLTYIITIFDYKFDTIHKKRKKRKMKKDIKDEISTKFIVSPQDINVSRNFFEKYLVMDYTELMNLLVDLIMISKSNDKNEDDIEKGGVNKDKGRGTEQLLNFVTFESMFLEYYRVFEQYVLDQLVFLYGTYSKFEEIIDLMIDRCFFIFVTKKKKKMMKIDNEEEDHEVDDDDEKEEEEWSRRKGLGCVYDLCRYMESNPSLSNWKLLIKKIEDKNRYYESKFSIEQEKRKDEEEPETETKDEEIFYGISIEQGFGIMCICMGSQFVLEFLQNYYLVDDGEEEQEQKRRTLDTSFYRKICQLSKTENSQRKLKHEILTIIDSYLWTQKMKVLPPQIVVLSEMMVRNSNYRKDLYVENLSDPIIFPLLDPEKNHNLIVDNLIPLSDVSDDLDEDIEEEEELELELRGGGNTDGNSTNYLTRKLISKKRKRRERRRRRKIGINDGVSSIGSIIEEMDDDEVDDDDVEEGRRRSGGGGGGGGGVVKKKKNFMCHRHWGIEMELAKMRCGVCRLPLTENVGSEICLFKCGHGYHAFCNSVGSCLICQNNSFQSLL